MAGDTRARRLAENEATFRNVNEGINDLAQRQSRDAHLFQFLCECSDISCTELVRMTLDDYERVRAKGNRFALMAGHEDPRIERVVERLEGYEIVEKLGEGAEVAQQLDPRG